MAVVRHAEGGGGRAQVPSPYAIGRRASRCIYAIFVTVGGGGFARRRSSRAGGRDAWQRHSCTYLLLMVSSIEPGLRLCISRCPEECVQQSLRSLDTHLARTRRPRALLHPSNPTPNPPKPAPPPFNTSHPLHPPSPTAQPRASFGAACARLSQPPPRPTSPPPAARPSPQSFPHTNPVAPVISPY